MNYQLLPELAADDYDRLRADIAERGVLVPVEVDEHGAILDGHHRRRIADELGIECPTVTRTGLAEHEKRLHAVSLNLARRHLTDAQKVMLGRTIEPDIAEAAEQRRLANLRQNQKDAERGIPSATTDALDEPERTVDEVARQVGLGSGRTYERAKATLAKAEKVAPEVVAKAERGEVTMRDVAKEVRRAEKAERVATIADAAPTTSAGGSRPASRYQFNKATSRPSRVTLASVAPKPRSRLHIDRAPRPRPRGRARRAPGRAARRVGGGLGRIAGDLASDGRPDSPRRKGSDEPVRRSARQAYESPALTIELRAPATVSRTGRTPTAPAAGHDGDRLETWLRGWGSNPRQSH